MTNLDESDPDIESGELTEEEKHEEFPQGNEKYEFCLKNLIICLIVFLIVFCPCMTGMVVVSVQYSQLSQQYTSLSKRYISLKPAINMPPNFKLIKPYFIENIPEDADYWAYLELKRQQCKGLPVEEDFWSDKLKTEKCLNGVENGVRVVPTIWSTQKKGDIEKLKEKLDELYKQEKNSEKEYILKPTHLMEAANIITISNDYNDEGKWDEIFAKINEIPITQEEMAKWRKKHYRDTSYTKSKPGLIMQEKFDIEKEYREIKMNVVWGKVINFKYMDEDFGGSIILGIDEDDNNSLYCEYFGRKTSKEKNEKKCNELKRMMKWDVVIPKIEKFASKLHLDYIRIDIFPIDHEVGFYINEIEVVSNCAAPFQDNVFKRLKSYGKVLKESENPEKYFLDPKLHDLKCDIFGTEYFEPKTEEMGLS